LKQLKGAGLVDCKTGCDWPRASLTDENINIVICHQARRFGSISEHHLTECQGNWSA